MQEKTAFVVFIQIFAVLENLLRVCGIAEASKVHVKMVFLSEITKMGLRSTERQIVMSFYKKPVGQLDINFQPSGVLMKQSVQSLYELLCEVIGPVDADKIFGATINKVSTSKAAQVYSPKKFL